MRYTGKYNAAVHAKCPYFCRDSEMQITCEGMEMKTNLSIKFHNEEQKNRHLVKNCLKTENCCYIKGILEQKEAGRR